jgi:hypothetical protein
MRRAILKSALIDSICRVIELGRLALRLEIALPSAVCGPVE